jgi:hypothetical protein
MDTNKHELSPQRKSFSKVYRSLRSLPRIREASLASLGWKSAILDLPRETRKVAKMIGGTRPPGASPKGCQNAFAALDLF